MQKKTTAPSAYIQSLDDISDAQRRMLEVVESSAPKITESLGNGGVASARYHAEVALSALKDFQRVEAALRQIQATCSKYLF